MQQVLFSWRFPFLGPWYVTVLRSALSGWQEEVFNNWNFQSCALGTSYVRAQNVCVCSLPQSKMTSRLLSFVWSSEQIFKTISCYFCDKLLMERIIPPCSGGISRNIPPSSGPHRAQKVWTGWRGPRAGPGDEQRAGEPALWGETGGEVVPLFNNNKIISLGLSLWSTVLVLEGANPEPANFLFS